MLGGGPGRGTSRWRGSLVGDEPALRLPGVRPRPTTRASGSSSTIGTTFTFVTEGIEAALEQAREAAGDKDVGISGGASVGQQYLKAGLVDELQLHVAPVLLGGGTRLFEDTGLEQIGLEPLRVADSPAVTHLKYRVVH